MNGPRRVENARADRPSCSQIPNADSGNSRTPLPVNPDHRFHAVRTPGAAAAIRPDGAQCPEPDQRAKGGAPTVARRRLSMRQIRDSLRLYWGQRLPMRQIARSVGIGLASVVESRDVVERCALPSARISYGLRWFCSLLPLERQGRWCMERGLKERRVTSHSSWISSSTAPTRRRTAWGVGKIPTASHRRASSRVTRSTRFVEWVWAQCPRGNSLDVSTSSATPEGRRLPGGLVLPAGYTPAPAADGHSPDRAGRRSSAPGPSPTLSCAAGGGGAESASPEPGYTGAAGA